MEHILIKVYEGKQMPWQREWVRIAYSKSPACGLHTKGSGPMTYNKPYHRNYISTSHLKFDLNLELYS